MKNKEAKILDVCCGSRMFWFDKNNPHTVYMDIRKEAYDIEGKHINVNPDIIGDFRNIPFPDQTFSMVVFDPPHLRWAGNKSFMRAQYGQLNETWPEDIRKGFEECFRVLLPGGFLIFKWSECQVKLKEILKLTTRKPLFGNQRGNTFWLVFMKEE